MDASVSKQQYGDMLRQYLHDISFQTPPEKPFDSLLQSAVIEFLQTCGFAPAWIDRMKPAVEAGAWIAKSTYCFVPRGVQEMIAIYTTLIITIEDSSERYLAHLKVFGSLLLHGRPQQNQLLEALVTQLRSLHRLYGPLASDMITKGTIDFVSACVVERTCEGRLQPSPTCPDFPDYFRLKSGVGEAYAFFAFPESQFPEHEYLPLFLPVVPDLAQIFNHGNDFLSFYKEYIVSDEQSNYISNYSQARNMTILQSLRAVMTSAVTSGRNVLDTLVGHPTMRNNMKHLISGYAMYHMGASRYRLDELDVAEIREARGVACLARES